MSDNPPTLSPLKRSLPLNAQTHPSKRAKGEETPPSEGKTTLREGSEVEVVETSEAQVAALIVGERYGDLLTVTVHCTGVAEVSKLQSTIVLPMQRLAFGSLLLLSLSLGKPHNIVPVSPARSCRIHSPQHGTQSLDLLPPFSGSTRPSIVESIATLLHPPPTLGDTAHLSQAPLDVSLSALASRLAPAGILAAAQVVARYTVPGRLDLFATVEPDVRQAIAASTLPLHFTVFSVTASRPWDDLLPLAISLQRPGTDGSLARSFSDSASLSLPEAAALVCAGATPVPPPPNCSPPTVAPAIDDKSSWRTVEPVLTTDSLQLDLLDQVSMVRVELPVRGDRCLHLQVFCAKVLWALKLPKCPLCGEPVTLSTLRQCAWTTNALQQWPTAIAVKVSKTGEVEPVWADGTKRSTRASSSGSNADCVFVSSSDENDEEETQSDDGLAAQREREAAVAAEWAHQQEAAETQRRGEAALVDGVDRTTRRIIDLTEDSTEDDEQNEQAAAAALASGSPARTPTE
uniref:SP-RING-type domain-containing protein n=1 Tax=Sexangularia sp. CB-2014 TaxID=1486929 RepID=A0A7S1VSN2_9EUKA|mmetsp:Transcript_9427/g.29951  ORF Transcript_9427/g.29951 Transcript_9427/m.29951 type:complete len:517 (+) Transcript_9427:78-1628(+)